ncbi:MAG: DUF5050 domain-containing protein, partial [Erysipelotrichaceae bacterium]|nr:DUF5050 domain-containing protein [Erysipelotrichaceae bacterium]
RPRKVYWRIVIAAVLALALITGGSMLYLKFSSPLNYVDDSGDNSGQDYSDNSVNTGAVETYNQATFDASATTQNEKFSNLCLNGKIDCDGSSIFMTDDSGRLVRLSTNFSDGSAIVNEKVSYINVADGRIYYCDNQNYVHSCNYDGSDNQTLISTATYYLTYYDGKLYYQNDPDNESLYVYDLGSGQSTKLVDRHMYNMFINDGVIYYCAKDGVYAYNISTKEDKRLVEGGNHSVLYYGGYIYYISSGGYLNRYSLTDGSVEAIYNDGSVATIAFSDKALYVYRVNYTSGSITRIDMETKTTTTVYEGILSQYTDFQVIGDHLVVKVDGHYQTINTGDGRKERIFK